MRHRLRARDLVADAAARLGLDPSVVATIFAGAPLDFPVVIAPHLPLLADRFGMIGITLAGRVWLLESVREFPAAALIALVRHEAEHVRQQRERPLLFFARYGLDYLRALVRPTDAVATMHAGDDLQDRAYRAYRSIGYEREAYAAEAAAWVEIERWRGSRHF